MKTHFYCVLKHKVHHKRLQPNCKKENHWGEGSEEKLQHSCRKPVAI